MTTDIVLELGITFHAAARPLVWRRAFFVTFADDEHRLRPEFAIVSKDVSVIAHRQFRAAVA